LTILSRPVFDGSPVGQAGSGYTLTQGPGLVPQPPWVSGNRRTRRPRRIRFMRSTRLDGSP